MSTQTPDTDQPLFAPGDFPRRPTAHAAALVAMIATLGEHVRHDVRVGRSSVQVGPIRSRYDLARGCVWIEAPGQSPAVRSYTTLPTLDQLRQDIAALRAEKAAHDRTHHAYRDAERATNRE